MSISTDLSISDLTAIIIAFISVFIAIISLVIAFKKNSFDKDRNKEAAKLNILLHYNELLELHIDLTQLVFKISDKEKQKKLLKINSEQLNEIQDLESIIKEINNNFELALYDRAIEVIFVHKKNIIKTKLNVIKEIEKTALSDGL